MSDLDYLEPVPPKPIMGTCPKCGQICRGCEIAEYGGCEAHFAEAQPLAQQGNAKMEGGLKWWG